MLNYQRFWLVVVPSLSGVQIFATPRTTECQAPSLSSIVSQFAHTQVHWIDDAPTISFSVIPSSCLQSLQAWGSFIMSRLFESDGHSIGTSATTSVLPMNMQGWFPFRLTGLISLLFKCKIPPWIKLKTHSFSLIPKEKEMQEGRVKKKRELG